MPVLPTAISGRPHVKMSRSLRPSCGGGEALRAALLRMAIGRSRSGNGRGGRGGGGPAVRRGLIHAAIRL